MTLWYNEGVEDRMENTYELFELDGTLYGTLTTWNPRLNPRPVVGSTPDTEGRVEVVYDRRRFRCKLPTR